MASTKEKWGVGNQVKAQAFDCGTLRGGGRFDLIHGEHPHSRQDNDVYARFPDGRIERFSGHRAQFDVRLRTFNYMKESPLSGNEIRKGGQCQIFLNGEEVYGFLFRDPCEALLRAREVLNKITEHPVDFRTENPIGRKVYFDGIPGTIKYWFPDQGTVVIDAEKGKTFPVHEWEAEEGPPPKISIKDDIFSERIWWHRK